MGRYDSLFHQFEINSAAKQPLQLIAITIAIPAAIPNEP